MTNILLHGCNGTMGRVVQQLAAQDAQCRIAIGIDPFGEADFPVYRRPIDCVEKADVLIDFSTASALDTLFDFIEKTKIPSVICTTGMTKQQEQRLLECSKTTAVLKSANMSVGVNLLLSLVRKAAVLLADSGFDIEIIEKHHNQKIDAPSGTALAIADSINEALDGQYHYCYDRSEKKEKREKQEIGIHAVRGGTIVGEHEVIFAGKDEIFTLHHTALSKEIFAVGAVKAAKFLAGKPAGLYSMADVMES